MKDYIIYLLFILAGFIAGLFRVPKERGIIWIIALLGLTFCSETVSKIATHTIKNNSFIYHFYNPVQLLFWAVFFYLNLNSWAKKTVWPITATLMLYAVVNTIFWQDLKTFPGNFIKFECLALLFWSFQLFTEYLERPASENIFRNSRYIICIAVIWFNLVSFLFFQLFNFFVDHSIPTLAIRNVHYYSNIMYYLLLLLAMTIKPTPETS